MSDNFAEPKVTISESGFDGNFWTFSLGNTKTNYVFVIPTNNLIEYEKWWLRIWALRVSACNARIFFIEWSKIRKIQVDIILKALYNVGG